MLAIPIFLAIVTLVIAFFVFIEEKSGGGLFMAAAAAMLLWAFVLGANGCYRGYSDGERSGYVVKISNKGVIRKTFEGSLRVSGPGC